MALKIGSSANTWRESPLIMVAPNFLARCMARRDLPDAVGPTIIMHDGLELMYVR